LKLLLLLFLRKIVKHGGTGETVVGRGLEFNYKKSSQVSVMDPEGNQSLFYLDADFPTAFMEVESAGLYEVLQQKGKSVERILVAANLDTTESDPNYTQPGVLKWTGGESILQGSLLEETEKFKRRDFFYRSLLITVLILLFLEVFLANRIYKAQKKAAE